MKDEKNFTQEELNEQSSTNAETQVGGVDWNAPAKLMNGEKTGTLTGDVVGEVSEELVNKIFYENAKHLRGEIINSLGIDENDKGAGTSLGQITTNRIKVMAEVMGIDNITRRDAMMALAGVFAVNGEMKIHKLGAVFK